MMSWLGPDRFPAVSSRHPPNDHQHFSATPEQNWHRSAAPRPHLTKALIKSHAFFPFVSSSAVFQPQNVTGDATHFKLPLPPCSLAMYLTYGLLCVLTLVAVVVATPKTPWTEARLPGRPAASVCTLLYCPFIPARRRWRQVFICITFVWDLNGLKGHLCVSAVALLFSCFKLVNCLLLLYHVFHPNTARPWQRQREIIDMHSGSWYPDKISAHSEKHY